MRELGQRAGGSRVLDHALDPLHALLEGALTETRRRIAERETELVQRASGALELVRGAETLRVPVERLRVMALVLAQPTLLQAEARERLRIERR